MVKCDRCSILVECKKSGKVKVIIKGESGKDMVSEVCPLLRAIQVVFTQQRKKASESEKQSIDNTLQTKEGDKN